MSLALRMRKPHQSLRAWLKGKPDGRLLVEVHTFDEVKRGGMAQQAGSVVARPVSCRASSAVNGKCGMKRLKPAQRSSGR